MSHYSFAEEKGDYKKSKLSANSKKDTITSEGEMSSEATAGQAFKCNVCDKDFDRPETLVVHQFMHKKFHQCADCKRSFVSEENLSKHKREFKHVFKCRICREEFPSQEVRSGFLPRVGYFTRILFLIKVLI